MTTGDRASGRSAMRLRKWRPRTFRRTMRIASPTPKMVLSGTAMRVMSTVSHSACVKASLVRLSHTAVAPSSNARKNTATSGTTSSASR